jgi:hypothetical protein
MKKMISKNADVSCSESSAEESDEDKDGKLIYLNVYLGPKVGNRILQGLSTDNPSLMARRFCKNNKISSTTIQVQIKKMILNKVKEFS